MVELVALTMALTRRLFSSIILPLVAGVLVTSAAAQTYPYTIVDIGLLPGDDASVAYSLNAAGHVVGFSGTTPPEPFLYSVETGLDRTAALAGSRARGRQLD